MVPNSVSINGGPELTGHEVGRLQISSFMHQNKKSSDLKLVQLNNIKVKPHADYFNIKIYLSKAHHETLDKTCDEA